MENSKEVAIKPGTDITMGSFDPPLSNTAMAEIEKSRAVQEVQAALVIAKKFPRDHNAIYTKIIESCKRQSLAKQAMYSYPRGNTVVTGPSIRLAEILAQNYQNLSFGVRELERKSNSSIAESFCWDLENNIQQSKIFEVPHSIELKGGKKKYLTDPRDIYELVANNGARRMRACIIGVLPGDLVEAAVKQCRKTLAEGGGRPLTDRIRELVAAFTTVGVSQEMLAERLKHPADLITNDEIVDLHGIFTAIRDKQSKRSDYFNFTNDDKGGDPKAEQFSEALKSTIQ
jgi:hypothetical protein